MFSRVQAEGYRSLRYIDQHLGPFHALVGPNASGKTTILEVIDLIGDLIRHRGDVSAAVAARTTDFAQLLWLGRGQGFAWPWRRRYRLRCSSESARSTGN